jgi:quercetin dioxygenase-like cupin family protein
MGRAVTLSSLPSTAATAGVARAAITNGEMQEMSAEFVRVGSGATFEACVPQGADGYLYMLNGTGRIKVDGIERPMVADSFAAIRETNAFTMTNSSAAPAELVYVLAPPGGDGKHAGLTEKLAVIVRKEAPTANIVDQKKKRTYFVSKEAAKSERGHAMIVEYEKDTVTPMHHHPNAASMFVPLSGSIKFVVNGEDKVLGRGQAVYFPTNDRHGLRCADGTTYAAFLEFHIPGAFTTIKE